jgi:hypothetical protein
MAAAIRVHASAHPCAAVLHLCALQLLLDACPQPATYDLQKLTPTVHKADTLAQGLTPTNVGRTTERCYAAIWMLLAPLAGPLWQQTPTCNGEQHCGVLGHQAAAGQPAVALALKEGQERLTHLRTRLQQRQQRRLRHRAVHAAGTCYATVPAFAAGRLHALLLRTLHEESTHSCQMMHICVA